MFYPPQGKWRISDYLDFDANTNHLIEFSNGTVEFLPMPSLRHQRYARALFLLLCAYIEKHQLGEAFFAPTKVKLWENKIREPDILFVSHKNVAYATEQWFERVDLVMEVVSPDDPKRDLVKKRREYAQAGIPEYWIADSRSRTISVLILSDSSDRKYTLHGKFGTGEVATSHLLPSFAVPVNDIFKRGQ